MHLGFCVKRALRSAARSAERMAGGRTAQQQGGIVSFSYPLPKWAGIIDAAQCVVVAPSGAVMSVTPQYKNAAGAFHPLGELSLVCPSGSLSLGRSILTALSHCPHPQRRGKPDIDDAEPSEPLPFGPDSSWLALATDDIDAVADVLGLVARHPCSWSRALRLACGTGPDVVVTPPLPTPHGPFTLVAPLRHLDPSEDRFFSYLEELSREFKTALFFATHAQAGYHAWAKAVGGEMQRAFAVDTLHNETLIDLGAADEAERQIIAAGMGDAAVLAMAGLWSVDPSKLPALSLPPTLATAARLAA